jgi:hypothetical protein
MMPRVTVTADDGTFTLSERVTPADFDSAHFRRCLCERLSWAVADADERSHTFTEPARDERARGPGHSAPDLAA